MTAIKRKIIPAKRKRDSGLIFSRSNAIIEGMLSYNPLDRHNTVYNWSVRHNIFSDEEIEKIKTQAESIPEQSGKVKGGQELPSYRSCTVQWMHESNDETRWIFDRIAYHIFDTNNQFFNYDLYGFDSIQYTTYEKKDYYDWHQDVVIGRQEKHVLPPRKLSASILLNDDFKGGEFEFFTGTSHGPERPPLKKGSILIFSSFMYHRVAPVTKGVRSSLVVWALGPKFK